MTRIRMLALAPSCVVAFLVLLLAVSACARRTEEGVPRAPVRIAVAANFGLTAQSLQAAFAAEEGGEVELVLGSTGTLYAQIVQGAPFDAFLSADEQRPRALLDAGSAVRGTEFVYAVGQVVLWSAAPGLVDDGGRVLGSDRYEHLAIANPDVAPYGQAAKAFLVKMGLLERVTPRLVVAQDVGQAFQFVASGNAELGFVAWSQLRTVTNEPAGNGASRVGVVDSLPRGGSVYLVPSETHAPLRQMAVLLREGTTARRFLEFVQTHPAALRIIADHGYRLPGEEHVAAQPR